MEQHKELLGKQPLHPLYLGQQKHYNGILQMEQQEKGFHSDSGIDRNDGQVNICYCKKNS